MCKIDLIFRKVLAGLRGKLILDETQANALAASLSREVSLIQGPPGTGKTCITLVLVFNNLIYEDIGIHIVHILLQNSLPTEGNRLRIFMI